jgi:hypothetical protein
VNLEGDGTFSVRQTTGWLVSSAALALINVISDSTHFPTTLRR